jgi:mannose/cellobiose epimerase-like protein (N-acyl-D-glucosamine 2-epimerase family)
MGELSAELRDWLFDAALPLWAERGVDRAHGGFVEALDPQGRPAGDFKRMRVAARQVYVFAHAALLGWTDGREIAATGFDWLVERAWLGPERGWARRLSVRGEVIDDTPDLYDLAFVLFAAGWLHRLTRDHRPIEIARQTLDFIETHMTASDGEGFAEAQPRPAVRLQNPHMHLLEAALVLTESTGESRFAALADALGELFARRLFDPATGTLGERFDKGWRGVSADPLEPGHHFEWVWLLAELKRVRGRDLTGAAIALNAFAETHGLEPTGAVRNAVFRDGTPLDRRSRTWPNTERLKAAVALHELTGRDPRPALTQGGRLLLDRYLKRPLRGSWHDLLEADGAPAPGPAPASTFYHLFLAVSETLRVAPALGL